MDKAGVEGSDEDNDPGSYDVDEHEDGMNIRKDIRRTLKHTQRLKGRVTRTISQERAVRSQPHKPIPSSPSSAGRRRL